MNFIETMVEEIPHPLCNLGRRGGGGEGRRGGEGRGRRGGGEEEGKWRRGGEGEEGEGRREESGEVHVQRMKKEASKVKQTNKAKQHSIPKSVTFPNMYKYM